MDHGHEPGRMQDDHVKGTGLSLPDMSVRRDLLGMETRHDPLSRRSSRGSSRRGSISFSRDVGDRILRSISVSRSISDRMLGVVDDSSIAQAGDSGDRVVVVVDDEAGGDCDNHEVSLDVENGLLSFPDDVLISSNGLGLPLEKEDVSPLPTDAILNLSSRSHEQVQRSLSRKEEKLTPTLDYLSYMIHLAVFGELGVLTRYLLQKFFGPDHLALTGDQTPLYLDLPANMLGSFLMGWFGIVFKADIRNALSDHIVVGLSTGYLGSLTTFSGWNQKMLNLSSKDHWVFSIGGVILGILLVNESIRIGVESAESIRRRLLTWLNQDSGRTRGGLKCWRINSPEKHMVVMAIMLLVLLAFWGLSGALASKKLDRMTDGVILWLGLLVGPPGVWGRWYLARLNGQGIGSKGYAKWLPIGTLAANIFAACLMATVSTITKAVNTKRCRIIVNGVQLGFLGCLSTVSTFVAEVYAMRQSGHSGRALAYVVATILPSFAMGILIYSVPVWTKHYE